MNFFAFDQHTEAFSDEEGHKKTIAGHAVGDARGALRIEKEIEKDKNDKKVDLPKKDAK